MAMKDLSGDGKITMKDVLIGRGVIGNDKKKKVKRAKIRTKRKHSSADKARMERMGAKSNTTKKVEYKKNTARAPKRTGY
tara:strand:- start:52 stop:291 length:240 start_codon:yes stop_codon:yes gene_type:complete